MYNKIALFFSLALATFCYSQETYYNDVNLNLTGLSLKEALAIKIISTHTQFLFYDQVWDASKATDVNPNNNQEVLLIYGYENGADTDATNDRTRGIDNNGGGSGTWNREHVYSQSLGTPALSDSGPGSDAHHLRPADAQRNSSRNNRKFTTGSGNSGIQASGGWYPGDEWKGDVARMMMYMYVRYDDRCLPSNIGFGDNSNTPDDMIDLFLQWNAEDPVSDFERQRNTYHENTANQNAQGNRNPFIDNPILATRIWGGSAAEDTWGIFTGSDTQAPTVPTNITANNITTFSIDLSWDAATDNIAVTSYDVYVNGDLEAGTSNTSITISNLASDTNYTITILAKDIVNNVSQLSEPFAVKTLLDSEAPTAPKNVNISNETETTFIVSWSASTDNTSVTMYEVYIDDTLENSTSTEMYTATNLAPSTTYRVAIVAVDQVGNKSEFSSTVNATTTNGSTNATELFFSEYFEGSFGTNKALEIVNLTTSEIDMSQYSIQRQTNGGLNDADWTSNLPLTGTIKPNDVYVIINESTTVQKLKDEADFIHPNNEDTNYGAPINFNGNDPVGLFKNDVLIDIVGTYNGGSSNFAKDKTLRRKTGVSQPNPNFDIDNEWDIINKDNADDFGSHSSIVLSTNHFTKSAFIIYPNPIDNILYISGLKEFDILNIYIYDYTGKKIITTKTNKKEINVSTLSKGVYIIQINSDQTLYSSKFIKK